MIGAQEGVFGRDKILIVYCSHYKMYDVKRELDYLIDLWFLFLKNSARLVPLDAIRQLKKVLGSPSCNCNCNRYGIDHLAG